MMSDPEPLPVPRIIEIREQLQALPGQRIVDAMRALAAPVRFVLVPNGQQLDQHLSAFHDGSLGYLPESEELQGIMDNYLGEVLRLTHNLVASVSTVVDQTRRTLEKNWPDVSHPVRTEFNAAKQKFAADGRLGVMRDLRNYFLHRTMPHVVGHTSLFQDSGPASSVLMPTASLLEWDGWKAQARDYLRSAGESIELRSLARNYCGTAVELQNGVIHSIQKHESAILEPWTNLAEEHDTHVRRVRTHIDQINRNNSAD